MIRPCETQTWFTPTGCQLNISEYPMRKHLMMKEGNHIQPWCHQMEAFSALLAICTGNWPVTGESPSQKPVTWSFDVFFDLRPNKGWVNNGEADDSRRHRAHYDVIIMSKYARGCDSGFTLSRRPTQFDFLSWLTGLSMAGDWLMCDLERRLFLLSESNPVWAMWIINSLASRKP